MAKRPPWWRGLERSVLLRTLVFGHSSKERLPSFAGAEQCRKRKQRVICRPSLALLALFSTTRDTSDHFDSCGRSLDSAEGPRGRFYSEEGRRLAGSLRLRGEATTAARDIFRSLVFHNVMCLSRMQGNRHPVDGILWAFRSFFFMICDLAPPLSDRGPRVHQGLARLIISGTPTLPPRTLHAPGRPVDCSSAQGPGRLVLVPSPRESLVASKREGSVGNATLTTHPTVLRRCNPVSRWVRAASTM